MLAVVIGVALMAWGFADDGGLVASDDPETTEPTDTDDPETTQPTDPATTDPLDGETQQPVLPEPRDPSEVGGLILNGSGVDGAAGRVNQALLALNYNMRPPDNAGEDVPATVIYHLEEWRAEAIRIAEELNISADVVTPMPTPAPHGVELGEETSIIIVLGQDELISAAAPAVE